MWAEGPFWGGFGGYMGIYRNGAEKQGFCGLGCILYSLESLKIGFFRFLCFSGGFSIPSETRLQTDKIEGFLSARKLMRKHKGGGSMKPGVGVS